MPATCTFRWTPAYSVSIEVFDQQHQQLFATVNELDQALQQGRGNSALGPIFDKLREYSGAHFAAEESLMAKHDYPGLSTHRAQHEMFRQKLAGFLEDYKAGKPGVPVSLLLFMQNWLKEHVLKTDKQYSGFLTARGER